MTTTFLCALFFVSGVSALLFETLWFHQAGLAFGNSVWATSLILSGFMGGVALGNALAARYGGRLANPVRTYALAEVAIALTGVGLVYALPSLGATLAPWLSPLLEHPSVLNLVRLLIAFLLLLLPSTAMGVTLPVLTKALAASEPNFGRVLGLLYGWNTLGAVMGAGIGELYLIRAFGIHGTALMAGALNLMAATGAARLSRQASRRTLVPDDIGGQVPAPFPGRRRWLMAALLSGFCLLALEVVWFRFLLLFVLGHSVAFALMLGIVLAGIALGGLTASRWLRVAPDAQRFAAVIAFGAGLACVGSYATFPLVIQPLETYLIKTPFDILRIGLPLMFPTSFFSGISFTLIGAGLRHCQASEMETTGVLTLANTTGAALGSLLGGFVFLPVLGMERSFFLLGILYGGVGILLLVRGPASHKIAYASAAVFLVGIAFIPFGLMTQRFLQIPAKRFSDIADAKIVATREGLTETVIFFQRQKLGRPVSLKMLTNAYSMSGTSYRSRRYMKLYVYWPMAVHPSLKHALLICFGVGNTAKALTDSRSLETIDVVDISRDILEMNSIIYPDKADRPLSDSRVRTHVEDGRFFLLTTDQRFDLITGEPPPPGIAGVENLYSREYFQLLYDRLADGGMVTYWLPIHETTDASTKAILRAFCDVFEGCSLWNGAGDDLMMIGTRQARGPVSEAQFIRQWSDPVVAPELWRLGLEQPEQLGALFIGDAAYLNQLLGDSRPLIDDDPKLIVAPMTSQAESIRLVRSFIDVAAAQERFRTSPLIKRLWPERLLTASLPYFEVQNMINNHFYARSTPRSSLMEGVHLLLTRSSLGMPVLWSLGSDSDIQRVVATATPDELIQPTMQFQLGLRFLVERHYAEAVDALSRAEQAPELNQEAFRIRIYALCLSGQTQQAQQLVLERFGGAAKGTTQDPFWGWMRQTFGIKLGSDVQTQGR